MPASLPQQQLCTVNSLATSHLITWQQVQSNKSSRENVTQWGLLVSGDSIFFSCFPRLDVQSRLEVVLLSMVLIRVACDILGRGAIHKYGQVKMACFERKV